MTFVAQCNDAHCAAFWYCAPCHAILETQVASMAKHTTHIMQHFSDMHRFGPKNAQLEPEAHPATPNECTGTLNINNHNKVTILN